jgi:hypothetical protein
MTVDDAPGWAQSLAVRIAQTWRHGPPYGEWVDALADLDEVGASTAFVRLRNERTTAPTIADLRSLARSLSAERYVAQVMTPGPLDLDDGEIVARIAATRTVMGSFAPAADAAAMHDRRLVGRVWQHSPQCARCELHEARFWSEVTAR